MLSPDLCRSNIRTNVARGSNEPPEGNEFDVTLRDLGQSRLANEVLATANSSFHDGRWASTPLRPRSTLIT
jgi:hypothetical protein